MNLGIGLAVALAILVVGIHYWLVLLHKEDHRP